MKLPLTVVAGALAAASAVSLLAQAPATPMPPEPPAPPAAPAPSYSKEQILETWGWVIAQQSGVTDLKFTAEETEAFFRGMRLGTEGKPSPQDVQKIGPDAMRFINERREQAMAEMRQKGQAAADAFFADLKNKANITLAPSGLGYEVVQAGTGPSPRPDQIVVVHYTGTLIDGTKFDSSRDRGEPAEFEVTGVVPGFGEGVQKMAKGGKAKLYVPPGLGYGAQSNGNIPPNSVLIFDVELLDIKDAPPPPPAPPSAPGLPTPTPAPAPAPTPGS